MELFFANNLFNLQCGVENQSLARRAGFIYNNKAQLWSTPFADVANKIAAVANLETIDIIAQKRAHEAKVVQESSAVWADFEPPAPDGLSYLPFQKAGIAAMMSKRNTLLADQMGLGKTVQALGFINVVKPSTVLVICPASLKANWKREAAKWLTYKPQMLIINYDILAKWSRHIHDRKWDVVIMDEAHYLKNPKAQRTKEVVGGRTKVGRRFNMFRPIEAARKIPMTGTPILNKPVELFTLLKFICPEGFGNKDAYEKRYCGQYRDNFGKINSDGATNLEELQQRLRSSIMVRRLKQDVLRDLPPKVRQVIEIEPNTKVMKALKSEAAQWEHQLGVKDVTKLNDTQYRDVVRLMSAGARVGLEDWSTVRKETALAKLPLILDFLKDAVLSSGKVIIFCHHKEVVDVLKKEFENCVTVVGGMSEKAKDDAVQRFQNDEEVSPFIGNMQAAGVGLTLTASSHVIFIEEDPVPGNVEQCEDRAHRISQLNSVLVQHLVLKGSLDATTAKIVVKKQSIITKAVDTQMDPWLSFILS